MARAGLSDACAISYIQYIGVVSAGLPAEANGGALPNSPIGIDLRPLFCAAAYCPMGNIASIHRSVFPRGDAREAQEIPRESDLFATPEQRSLPFGAAQQGQKGRKR